MDDATITVVGFDSAWTDKPRAPGAICAIRVDRVGNAVLVEPRLASFTQALEFIGVERALTDHCLVALDQPTIVPNLTSSRPVDRVAASLISWLGGGVQPANRSKLGMFDDAAPVWRFLTALGATEDPERARLGVNGLHLIEVFPALAIASLEASFFGRLLGPRYNPARRKTFNPSDWQALLMTVENYAAREHIAEVDNWIASLRQVEQPRKADQDKLDSLLCAIVGYHWLRRPRDESIMIGDLTNGYMISTATPAVRERLRLAAFRVGVPIDGELPTAV